MKKTILCAMLLAIVSNSFCQEIKPSQSLIREDYLKKSKKQKTIAWVLLGGGAASIIVGAIIPEGELTDQYGLPYFTEEHKNDGIKSAFYIAGGISALGSIPFFIISGRNKRKGMTTTVGFNNQRVVFPQQNAFVSISQPTLTLKIEL